MEVINAEAINSVDPGGGRSMIDVEAIDDQHRGDQHGGDRHCRSWENRSMIDVEAINDQCRGDRHCRSWGDGSTINVEAINAGAINTVDPDVVVQISSGISSAS